MDEIEKEKEKIRNMSHLDMAILIRFGKSGHPYFDATGPYWELLKERFDSFGGMTPEISKQIGWEQ